jgi:hypothetical protein
MIVDRKVRELYDSFLYLVCGFHEAVKQESTRVEIRLNFEKRLLCRVVPYRELFHVQVGEENAWEIRVRDEAALLDTVDRVLARFLQLYASREVIHPTDL